MLKEAFSYVNGILDLMLEDQKEDENRDKKPRTAQNLDNSNESFPDIDITSDSNDASLKEKGQFTIFTKAFFAPSHFRFLRFQPWSKPNQLQGGQPA